MEWIDGPYDVGQLGFLIRKRGDRAHWAILRDRPAHTNQSHQPRLVGWCGAWNNVHTTADGIARVLKVARNGRVAIEAVTDPEEIAAYLELVGYPELTPTAGT